MDYSSEPRNVAPALTLNSTLDTAAGVVFAASGRGIAAVTSPLASIASSPAPEYIAFNLIVYPALGNLWRPSYLVLEAGGANNLSSL